MSLADEVRSLAAEVVGRLGEHPLAAELRAGIDRLDQPLRVAIAGKVKAGKSTLLNALVGEELAPTDAGECTRIITWYRDGLTYRVVLHPVDGAPRQARFTRDGGAIEVDLDGLDAAEVSHLDVEWPSSRLREMTLIDTPGIESLSTDVSQRTVEFLTPEDERATDADAVVYLLRHTHASDVRFLEAFHDDEVGHPSPVNAIGILARADEVGACRPDAMESAARIAARYRDDPKLRRLVQTVVPVAGLVAVAGATLSEAEYRALTRLAELPDERRDDLVLTVDRFVADDPTLPVTAVEREDLLGRLGLFGIRHALTALASGAATTSQELARSLLAVSGIDELRRTLLTRFGERADVLKARSLLGLLDARRGELPAELAAHVDAELERLTASAHELTEIRLLDAVRSGDLRLRAAEREEAERLASGATAADRLGLEPDAEPPAILAAAYDALGRWQARAENPMSDRAVQEVARALVRTCERLVAGLAEGADR